MKTHVKPEYHWPDMARSVGEKASIVSETHTILRASGFLRKS